MTVSRSATPSVAARWLAQYWAPRLGRADAQSTSELADHIDSLPRTIGLLSLRISSGVACAEFDALLTRWNMANANLPSTDAVTTLHPGRVERTSDVFVNDERGTRDVDHWTMEEDLGIVHGLGG